MNLLKCPIPGKNFLTETSVNIILKSWRPEIARRYGIYIKIDNYFVIKIEFNPVLPPLPEAIEFLTRIYKSGVGY